MLAQPQLGLKQLGTGLQTSEAVGTVTSLVKRLLFKNEDLSLNPKTYVKSQAWWQILVIPVQEL